LSSVLLSLLIMLGLSGICGKWYLQNMTYISINSNLIYFYHLRWVAEKFIWLLK